MPKEKGGESCTKRRENYRYRRSSEVCFVREGKIYLLEKRREKESNKKENPGEGRRHW